MSKDRYQKTVKIPFVVQQGELRFLHDPKRKLELREGATGDMVLDSEALLDKVWRPALEAKTSVIIAHKGAVVLLEMKPDAALGSLRSELLNRQGAQWDGQEGFVSLENVRQRHTSDHETERQKLAVKQTTLSGF